MMLKTWLARTAMVVIIVWAASVSASSQCPVPSPFRPIPEGEGFQLSPAVAQTLASLPKDSSMALVNFWASWCQPCKKELPMLARLQQAFPATDHTTVAIHAINVGDTQSNRETTLEQTGAVAIDSGAINNFDALRAMGAQGLPYTLLFRNQKPAYIATGYLSTPEQTLYEWLQCLQQNPTK